MFVHLPAAWRRSDPDCGRQYHWHASSTTSLSVCLLCLSALCLYHLDWPHLLSSKGHLLGSAGDFPDVNRYREILAAFDLSTFPKLRDKDIKNIEDVLSQDIPSLVRQFDNPYGGNG